MSKKTQMHRTQLFLPIDLHKELLEESRFQGITISEIVRQVLTQYLQKHSREDTEAGTRLLLDMAEWAEGES
jgi:post-segregation antitoxin (ccd killing protein)